MAHSPADVAHVELPDLGVEDVLELQLRQLTLAQFTVASMECAIPLLKTGKCQYACLFQMILFGQIWVVKLFFKPLINNLSLNCLFVLIFWT